MRRLLASAARPDKFAYPSAIGQDSLRLLQIERSPTLTFGLTTVQLCMKTFRLDELPKYIALSYTWGPPENGLDPREQSQKHPILINGQTFQVLPNLFHALKQLRSDVGGRAAALLWIDAICINQDDLIERASQVAIMDQVYKRATGTVVWLGKITSAWEKGKTVHMLNQIRRIPKEEVINMALKHPNSQSLYPTKPLDRYGLPDITGVSAAFWIPILRFFQRNWFSRVWIVQEILLSQNIIFLWGDESYSWDAMKHIAMFMTRATQLGDALIGISAAKDKGATVPEMSGPVAVDNPISRFFSLCLLRDQCLSLPAATDPSRTTSKEPLWEHMRVITGSEKPSAAIMPFYFGMSHRPFLATDLRDKIYGFLGIANHMADNEGIARPSIKPDYDEASSPQKLFREMVVKVIEETGRLTCVTSALDPPGLRLPGLPSWVPDLSVAEAASPINFINPPFNSSGWSGDLDALDSTTTHRLAVDKADQRLRVSAFQLTRLSGRGENRTAMTLVEPDAPLSAGNIYEKFGIWLQELRKADPRYWRTGQTRVEAFWETIIMKSRGGVFNPSWIDHGERGEPFWAWMISFIRWNHEELQKTTGNHHLTINEAFALSPALQAVQELASTDKSGQMPDLAVYERTYKRLGDKETYRNADESVKAHQQGFLAKMLAFGSAIDATAGHRRFALCDDGQFALVPEWAADGDEVFIVARSPCPLVLRRHPDDASAWTLVGSAYVHSEMYGAAVRGQTSWQEVSIL